jgi:Bacterial Ig-like domain
LGFCWLSRRALAGDLIVPDGDDVAVGGQQVVNLGTVAPGTVITKGASFKLVCNTKQHIENGQTAVLTYPSGQSTIPAGGRVSVKTTNQTFHNSPTPDDQMATIGPVSGWPTDGAECATPTPQEISGNDTAEIKITAPSTAGAKSFAVRFNHSESPVQANDSSDLQSNNTTITYNLTVDNTAPTVSGFTPTGNSELITTNVTATFSEAMDEASVEAVGNFPLTKSDGPDAGSDPDLVTATSVVYDPGNQRVTFDPNGNLDYSTTYTATVKGGATGVKDVAGNALAADKTWTFTTEPSPNVAPVATDDTLVLVLRNKAIPTDAGNVQGAVGGHLDREPEHLIDVVTILGA